MFYDAFGIPKLGDILTTLKEARKVIDELMLQNNELRGECEGFDKRCMECKYSFHEGRGMYLSDPMDED